MAVEMVMWRKADGGTRLHCWRWVHEDHAYVSACGKARCSHPGHEATVDRTPVCGRCVTVALSHGVQPPNA